MASLQEPEVQFAQRLASNEKPVRTKAIKKLRKYIHVRSQKAADGFTPDELLKLWKGLFYCLWMQDKPLLQEQLSNQISGLIHSFQDVDGQLLFVQSFLQTFKREWTGIDRLRMDKFLQLIRFMFRQTFQMLKKTHWDSSLLSVVSRFLQLLAAQLLQSGCEAPCGLQLHVLDVYLSELATVAADELTADQNLVFIEPFCKTAARTKDRTLFGAIRSSIFSTIIEQAPFAIEDLMRELKAAADSDPDSDLDLDPGQAKSKEDEDDEDEPLEESDPAGDEDVGPVLQFDYGALAAKLFELASRSSTPNRNRQQLYSLVRVLRNLSEGIFPQHEVPEEVSTDEDDDMFCNSRVGLCNHGNQSVSEKKDGSLTSEQKKDPVKEKTADSETGAPPPGPRSNRRSVRRGAAENGHAPSGEDTLAPTPAKKKRKRTTPEEEVPRVEKEDAVATVTAEKKKKIQEAPRVEKEDAVATVTAQLKRRRSPRRGRSPWCLSSRPMSCRPSPTETPRRPPLPQSDFVAFQTSSAPSPLFWRTRGGAGRKTPTSESKKVTFGLSSNQTAEFRKWDRSLLLSPDGSRRVPFDPQQKPKCGVLLLAAAPSVSLHPSVHQRSFQ
uniref:Ribosomal RNA processing 1 n=1 Tax=Tetraodon nigroviridis TaxID=99883 RepID=H3CHJ0_TETNG